MFKAIKTNTYLAFIIFGIGIVILCSCAKATNFTENKATAPSSLVILTTSIPPKLTFSSLQFTETTTNQGILNDNKIRISLIRDSFSGKNNQPFSTNHYSVKNLPEGIIAHMTKIDDQNLDFYLSGIAVNHHIDDDIPNLTLTFKDTSFSSKKASNIINSTINTIRIKFNIKIFSTEPSLSKRHSTPYLKSELLSIRQLSSFYKNIKDISDIKYLTNLNKLHLSYNELSDIQALKNLTKLTKLYLYSNQISDISPLTELTSLTHLSLENNQISDISALTELTNLTHLYLKNNALNTSENSEDMVIINQLKRSGTKVSY